MSTITVKQLKNRLQNAIDTLEELEDDQKIHLESNTYFINGARTFVGISGYDGGYLDLDRIEDNLEDDDRDEEE